MLDPALMLVTDLICCEDGHAQERSLIGQVLPLVDKGDSWVADRNFCTIDLLAGISRRGAFYVIRRHANITVEPQDASGKEVEAEMPTGWVSERRVWLCRDGGRADTVAVHAVLQAPPQQRHGQVRGACPSAAFTAVLPPCVGDIGVWRQPGYLYW